MCKARAGNRPRLRVARCVVVGLALGLLLTGGAGSAGAVELVPDFSDRESLCRQPLVVTVRKPTVGELQQKDLIGGEALMTTFVVVDVGVGIAMVEAGVLPTIGNLSAAVFGVVLPLTYGIAKAWEHSRRRTLEQAIAGVAFVPLAEAALRLRLPPACTAAALAHTPDAIPGRLELLILGYGLRGARGATACSFALAHATLTLPDRPPQTVRIAVGESSDDPMVPAPYCAEIGHFLEEDGAVTARAVEDAAATLGALVAHRLRPAP